MRRTAVVILGLVLLIGVLWVLGRDQAVEEATITSTVAAASTTAASTTTTVPASALDGIVLYVADGCAECASVEARLRGLAGEVPVWVRPADGTVSRVPTVVFQFDGRVLARWEGQVAVNSPEAVAVFAGARWPTGTIPTTTTTVPGIVVDPAPLEPLAFRPWLPLVAVSDREVWAVMFQVDASRPVVGHITDGVWTLSRPSGNQPVTGLAVAPDGTVWAATAFGVFSFDGVEWSRRFDGPAGAVAVDEGGTVWIGGWLEEPVGMWLARLDGESWVRVDPTPQAPPAAFSTTLAVLPNGEIWIAGWNPWGVGSDLMRYDGATMEAIQIGDYQDTHPESGVGAVQVFVIEGAPNGDVWIGRHLTNETLGEHWVLARFDGDRWTFPDWPLPVPLVEGLLFDMAVGPDGVVWFASEVGLFSFDGTDWTTRIEGHPISAVDVAPDGTVWYADGDGINRLFIP